MATPTVTDRFLHLAQHPQLGWAALGIKAAETVYEHSLDMAALVHKIAPRSYPAVDVPYCAEMCMMHGITEAVNLKDAPSVRNPTWRLNAMDYLVQNTVASPVMERIAAMYHEYVENKTPEARLAQQLDSLQMASRTLRYEQADPSFNATVLWGIARHRISDAPLIAAYNEMVRQRPADIDDRPHVEAIRINQVNAQLAHQEVLARVGNFMPVVQERKAAFSRYPYNL